MKRNDLDHAFDPTPHVFTNRVDAVLHTLKEDEPVKKFTLRTAMVALLYTMLLCSIACAVVLTQGQEWYYNNRFTAYQENEPDKQRAIFEHLETEVPQEPSKDSKGLVDVTVQDYAWVPSKNLFTISLAARVKDSGTYELHPMMAMDPDGYWTPVLDPADKEDRTEHWLSAKKGFGPPADVMDDPSKQLLLADMDSSQILIGSSDVALNTWTFDSFTGEDGAVIAVMEIDLKQLDADYIWQNYHGLQGTPSPEKYIVLRPGDSGDDVKELQDALAKQGYYQGAIDGLYSDAVISAVIAFQKAHQLMDDGIAGPDTRSKIYAAATAGEDGSKLVSTPSPEKYIVLRPGDSGDAVKELQDALAKQGYYHGDIDGLYNDAVTSAVIAFQKAHQLMGDGIAGPDTRSKIYAAAAAEDNSKLVSIPPPEKYITLHPGDSGDDVRKLQDALAMQGYYHGDIDGLYSDDVSSAVAAFQKANLLVGDGIAGTATQSKLYAASTAYEGSSELKAIPPLEEEYTIPRPGDLGDEEQIILRPGDSGDDVARLQDALAKQGYYHGDIDGLYSDDVSSAVMAFQEAHQLMGDGIAGTATQFMIYVYEIKEDAIKTHTGQEMEMMKVYEEGLSAILHSVAANAAIEQYTDAEGMLSLRLPYQIVPFENGSFGTPTNGVAVFKVKIR